LTEYDDRINASEFAEVVHPNGTTAWEAGCFAALALEYELAEVVTGWNGINADEFKRIQRATVRKLVGAYSEALDRTTDPQTAKARAGAARMLEAVQDDDFATSAALALVIAHHNLPEGVNR
jgi:hypothetical protein